MQVRLCRKQVSLRISSSCSSSGSSASGRLGTPQQRALNRTWLRARNGGLTRCRAEPVLLCSDLDGTMVGDDASTAAFSARWADHPERKCLVYSTGRTLAQYLELEEEKRGCLHEPDYLITAVGTRVYEKVEGEWREDKDWTKQLEKNWCTEIVLQCVEATIEKTGESCAHLRPKHEQNEHKVTLGIKSNRVEGACLELNQMLGEKGVQAKLVYSGSGDWKYLDVLSKQAGKRSSLDFVRQKTNFLPASTVAAGDSGNDIDFMEGENRAIIVGNAQDDLVDWYRKQGSKLDAAFKERVIFTEEKMMASGIVAGLESFNIF